MLIGMRFPNLQQQKIGIKRSIIKSDGFSYKLLSSCFRFLLVVALLCHQFSLVSGYFFPGAVAKKINPTKSSFHVISTVTSPLSRPSAGTTTSSSVFSSSSLVGDPLGEEGEGRAMEPTSSRVPSASSSNGEPGEREPLLAAAATSASDASSVLTDSSETGRSRNRSSGISRCISEVNWLLLFYFALFYAGNYGYSLTNKLAVQEAMFPCTIATLNFGLGCLAYVPILWMTKARPIPWKLSWKQDIPRLLPVALFTAGSHTASVYGYAHGSVSFVNIVKTAEPVFCALLSQFGGYGQYVSVGKWCTLPVIIAGVILASKNEYQFSWIALVSACVANLIAAIRSNETKALLTTPGLQERLQGAGNQFALTALLGFLFLLPCALVLEGPRYGQLWQQLQTSTSLRHHIAWASFYFYGYNELRTVTLKQTSAVTGSIANTLKRVLIVIVVAMVLREHMTWKKLLGCLIAITGVLMYSTVDAILPYFQKGRRRDTLVHDDASSIGREDAGHDSRASINSTSTTISSNTSHGTASSASSPVDTPTTKSKKE